MTGDRLPRTCIVGAGSSGIATAKVFHPRGLPFDCYEASDRVGGNWVLGNKNRMSSCYRGLFINTSKTRMQYSDYPMPDHYPDFPHHSQIAEYFERYVDHFGFRRSIRFETPVRRIEKRADGRYDVHLPGDRVEIYDAVAVANGHHWDPRWPDPPPSARYELVLESPGLIKAIEEYRGILASKAKRMAIVWGELLELKEKYGDPRRTEIIEAVEDFSIEDLIAEEDVVITISHEGYIKRLTVSAYRRQGRGGRGVRGMDTKETDVVEHLFIASTHDYILFFTTKGRCYWLKVHAIPQGGKLARGKNIANLLELSAEEKITAFVPVKKFDDEHFIVMATANGTIKKTALSRPRG